MDDLKGMSPAQLLENFRSLCRGIGATSNKEDMARLQKTSDLYEQEILRRIAW